MIYKFTDHRERLTKKRFRSWKEAQEYAQANHLTCLTMAHKDFQEAFNKKIKRMENHYHYTKLETMANQAIIANPGAGHTAIAANDFMHRIIEMPTPYIIDWLEGKNRLEWLPDYVSETECERKITYMRPTTKEADIKTALDHYLNRGTQGMKVFHNNQEDMAAYEEAVQFWSNSMGELHHPSKYDISEEELPTELKHIYQTFDIFEKYGSRCYLAETESGYGVALVNEYDECFANDCSMTMDRLFFGAVIDAAAVCAQSEFDRATVYLGEGTGFEASHELIVIFPADISIDDFKDAAALLDSIVYKAAPGLQKADEILDLDVLFLDVNGWALNALNKSPFSRIGELLCASDEDLMRLPGWGEKTREEVKRAIETLQTERSIPYLKLWGRAVRAYAAQNGQEKRVPMDLRKFLSYFDFDYGIVPPGGRIETRIRQELLEDGNLAPEDMNKDLICLIDNQGAYFGGIGNMRYPICQGSVEKIIDRMDIYVQDSVIKEFSSALENRDMDTTGLSLSDMIAKCKELGVGEGEVCYELAEAVNDPKHIYIEETCRSREETEYLFENLKSALFSAGLTAIEGFLGYEINPEEDKDIIEKCMDLAYSDMSNETLDRFFKRYGVGDKLTLSERISSAERRTAQAGGKRAKELVSDLPDR